MPIGCGLTMKAFRPQGGPFIVLIDNNTTDPTFYFWTRSEAGVWSLAPATFQHDQGANSIGPVIGRGAFIVPGPPQIGIYGGGAHTYMINGVSQAPFNTVYRTADNWTSYTEGTAPGSAFPESATAALGYPAHTDDAANAAFIYYPFSHFARNAAGRIVAGRQPTTFPSVRYDLETVLVYSDDGGAHWSPITFGSSVTDDLLSVSGIAYSPTLDRFVASVRLSGGVSTRSFYSDNGSTWEQSSLDNALRLPASCVWTGTHFVIFTSGSGITGRLRSTDGSTWSSSSTVTGGGGSHLDFSAADGSGVVLACSTSNAGLVRSINHGSTFAAATMPAPAGNSRALCWWQSNGAFWRAGQTKLIRSATGATGSWVEQTLPTDPAITRELVAMAFPD